VIFGSRFLDNGSTDSETIYSFGNCDSSGSFLVLQCIRHFCSLTPKTGLKSAYRSTRNELLEYPGNHLIYNHQILWEHPYRHCLQPYRIWRHYLLPVGSKSHKRVVNFWWHSDRDFSIMVQPIPKWFTVLETVIQGVYFLLCNLLDIFAPWPRKWGSSGPTVVYALHRWLILILSATANASSCKI